MQIKRRFMCEVNIFAARQCDSGKSYIHEQLNLLCVAFHSKNYKRCQWCSKLVRPFRHCRYRTPVCVELVIVSCSGLRSMLLQRRRFPITHTDTLIKHCQLPCDPWKRATFVSGVVRFRLRVSVRTSSRVPAGSDDTQRSRIPRTAGDHHPAGLRRRGGKQYTTT